MAESDRYNHIPIEDLSAYADGAYLSASERDQIEQHLAVCAECREELESLRAVSALLGDLPEPELPRSFRLSPEDAAAAHTDPSPEPDVAPPWVLRYQSAFRYAGLAAALLLAVIMTIDLLPGDDDVEDEFTLMEEPAVDVADDPVDEPATLDEEDAAEAPEPEVDQDAVEEEAAEEAAPEEDRDAIADVPVDEPAVEPDDESPEIVPEAADDPDDHPVADPDAEDGDHPVAVETPAPDEAEPFDTRVAMEEDDDGLSGMQFIAIGLAIASVTLLTLGFVVPRWSSVSA